jgi:hypothetical protein
VSEYRIDSTSEADGHARAIDVWWQEHRSVAPDLFLRELTHAFTLLATLPMLGAPYDHPAAPKGTRRLLLRPVKCHLYYTVDTVDRSILIRAIWHSSREAAPF